MHLFGLVKSLCVIYWRGVNIFWNVPNVNVTLK